MWVLTMGVNDYNQHGEYFVTVFDHKPTFEELKSILGYHENDENISRILNGDDPLRERDVWYYLRKTDSGKVSPFINFI